MIVDLTHSSDPSFFQALDVFSGPVIASHNNCRAIIPGDRQYSDEQIKLLIQRKAVIGASCDGWMLYPNYKHGQTPKDAITYNDIVNHIDHICQIAGNTNHVAIGSDLDGGFGYEQTPKELNSIADLQLARAGAEIPRLHGRRRRQNLPRQLAAIFPRAFAEIIIATDGAPMTTDQKQVLTLSLSVFIRAPSVANLLFQ